MPHNTCQKPPSENLTHTKVWAIGYAATDPYTLRTEPPLMFPLNDWIINLSMIYL